MPSLSAVGASTSGSRSHTVTWMTARTFLLGPIIVALPRIALADPDKPDDKLDHTIIVGGAAELELGDGFLHPGANVTVEWDAIENWLELEVGASVITSPGGVQVPVDLLITAVKSVRKVGPDRVGHPGGRPSIAIEGRRAPPGHRAPPSHRRASRPKPLRGSLGGQVGSGE